ASAIISSSLLWIGISAMVRQRPRTGYSVAALVSPIVGLFVFVGVYWVLSLGELDAGSTLTAIMLLYVGAFYFTWPVSIGAAVTCYFITRPRVTST
ncbi:MAG: hypothetical protein KDN05_18075, partial [Verrucomicrobiae bacterium]|nr:hypothetical protein [Verrucomicrobiae bacterium]